MNDDIPIGSPPVPPGRHAAPSGWYPDPLDPASERYWDGWQWSRATRPAPPGQQRPGQQRPGQQRPGPPGAGGPWPPGGQGAPPRGPYPPHPSGPIPPGGTKASTTADGARLAGWGARAVAAIIDTVITSILSMIAGFSILRRMAGQFSAILTETYQAAQQNKPAPTVTADQLMSTQDQLVFGLIVVGVGLVYYGLFWRLRGQTLGDLIMGLKVVHAGRGTDRTPLAWTQVIARSVLWVVPQFSLCFVVFVILNCLFPLWQPNRQAIHDLAARTQVISVRRGASAGFPPR